MVIYLGWVRDNLTGTTKHLIEFAGRRKFITPEEWKMIKSV